MSTVADRDVPTRWVGFSFFLVAVATVTAIAFATFRTRDV